MLIGGTHEVSAATAPNLGAADSFSILGQTAITSIPTSVISGDVGMNASGASITGLTTAEVGGTIFATDLVAPSEGLLNPAVQSDATTAYGVAITGQPIEGAPIFGALDGQTRGPGVYDLGAGLLGGGIFTLDGPGVYIFRTSSSLTSAGSINLINGARACDVFWHVTSDATINSGGPGTSFAGTILSGTGIHFGTGAALDGRALAIGGDVTMDSNTISGPICVVPPPPPPPAATSTPSSSSSGGSSSSPRPRIHVEKVALPDELPDGPGTVVYEYTVTNPGVLALHDVEVSDDKCSEVEFMGGDDDDDDRLDRDEEWSYECTMMLSETTTNTVTARGESSSGRETEDTDEATVVVTQRILALPLVQSTLTTPRLPNTGVAPEGDNAAMGILILATSLGALFLARSRRKAAF